MVHKLLFVCTGNICRSPTMEGVMRHLVRRQGLEKEFHLDSAGTHGYHVGEAPDARSIKTAAKYGVDISDLVARRVAPTDFNDYDLLLVADYGHSTILKKQAKGEAAAKVQLFLPYSGITHTEEVPDPYYGPQQGFDEVFSLIEAGCTGLLKRLKPA